MALRDVTLKVPMADGKKLCVIVDEASGDNSKICLEDDQGAILADLSLTNPELKDFRNAIDAALTIQSTFPAGA